MTENKSISLRLLCGIAVCYVALALMAGYARRTGMFFDSPRDWRMIELALSVTSGNQLAYLHWQRFAPDPRNHWSRLTLPMILHQLGVCIAAAIVVHFIFMMT
ncbi:hypothetical protein [Agrobacterium sp. NPDC090283]|uniref:hypothetical protein n=1 Tax=Agrobacterium sp. NPDC090283 TaxID=3363920 RepID=UPI003839E946